MTQEDPAREPISLESLTNAFAEMMGQGEPSSVAGPELDELEVGADDEMEAGGEPPGEDDDPTPITPRSVLEAILFVGQPDDRGVGSEQIAEQIRGVEPEDVAGLVESLNAEYAEQHAAMEVVRQEGGYRLRLRPEYHRVRDRFYGKTKEAKLSQQAIEVLALVAYNQPITPQEVSEMRGRPSGSLLNQLVRRQLLALERTEEKPRRTIYSTTGRFLSMFGLGSLEELPHSPEFDD
ncbi:MAG: SMC-Scp complex subunit ScpB [Pirellulales bacterium]